MKRSVYQSILRSKKKGKKLFSVLVDPDKFSSGVIREAHKARVNFIFIGGSKIKKWKFHRCVSVIRKLTNIPLVIFPGSREQVSEKADAILLLSLISGRNPDYLIGEHIQAARQLKRSGLEIIPTGYILIGGGKNISTQAITRTSPIKSKDNNLAVSTAIAGELLGMKLIYLEAGSGTNTPLNRSLVKEVRKNISVPVIAGGGIDTAEKAVALCRLGADMIVVGNAIEKDTTLVHKIVKAIHSMI
ncbi:MAG: geranylgeranylglyceryl/heptaprenylglyceryl phosphate synthase [Bacteroidetes bacterium]|nr:MAG: geranylgeranylglyceryl/heptaprenylglyceryl phosphate synthase [Bacteroidota bacterium]